MSIMAIMAMAYSPMPTASPMPAATHIPAAVVRPRMDDFVLMMAPAPRKPMPLMTCAATRAGSLLVAVVCFLVNLRWKLSEHMAGMGAVIGGLAAFSELFNYNPVWWLCFFILVSGMLGSARIILKHHTLGEVLGGFFTGLVCSILVLDPFYGVMLRIFFHSITH